MAVYLICYLASYILARFGHYLISGLLLLAAAGWLYMEDYRKYKNLIHLRGLFSLFWVGGEGLACLKLSSLQTDWSNMTWFCLFLAYIGFWLVFEILVRVYGSGYDGYGRWSQRQLYLAMYRCFCAGFHMHTQNSISRESIISQYPVCWFRL